MTAPDYGLVCPGCGAWHRSGCTAVARDPAQDDRCICDAYGRGRCTSQRVSPNEYGNRCAWCAVGCYGDHPRERPAQAVARDAALVARLAELVPERNLGNAEHDLGWNSARRACLDYVRALTGAQAVARDEPAPEKGEQR